ncbi:MAG: helix-turn-helix transcriptional regulator [Hyphomonadaceae bacterium]|nr:helix-turn-helix transcriptional regulator [Hyphomonadaceae bacterium]
MTVSDVDLGGFGAALRTWRRARGMSQLDLALAADASPRHLSFLETNRAKPSRDMVLTLADAMVLPRAACNALLNAAGYAPLFPVTPLDAAALGPLRAILDEMMQRHAPNPALLCDRHWTVLDATPSARALLSGLQGESGEMNVIRMLTHSPLAPEGIVNFPEVLQEMAGRIRLEALEAGADPVLAAHLRALEEAMRRHPAPAANPRRPLAPLVLRGPGGELSFLSTIAHFGTSEDVTVRDLRLELLFPADDATRTAMAGLR